MAYFTKEASRHVRNMLMVAIWLLSSTQFYYFHCQLRRDDELAIHPGLDAPSSLKLNTLRSLDNRNATGTSSSSTTNTPRRVEHEILNSRDAPLHSVPTNSTKNLTFCGSCAYSMLITCNERLHELMNKYNLANEHAEQELLTNCGIDYSAEPFILLHVGPHKTGTTTIQDFLYNSFKSNATYLDADNLTIPTHADLPGHFKKHGAMLNFAHCMIKNYKKDGGRVSIGKCNEIRKIFPSFLENAYEQSKNVFIVAEDLDRLEIDFVRILYWLKPYRRIRVVVNYRRLHHWLRSFYDQIVDMYTPKYIRGIYPYPSFLDFIDEKYNHLIRVHSIEVANRYCNSNKFEHVSMLNMHSGVNLLEDLFCNHIPFANATCEIMKSKAIDVPRSNKGQEHEFERLATQALHAGKLKEYHSAIAKKIATKFKKLLPDERAYPVKCINQTFLSNLLQREKELEEAYFREWYESQGGDAGLTEDFEKSKRKFCSMNTDFILSNGMFDHIFDELNKEK